MTRKKGMSSEAASRKKKAGHEREFAFAELIGGQVQKGSPIDKKDVIDRKHRAHSVKGGDKKWQIFLYSRSHFIKDDIFHSLNGLSDIFIACIDVFPETMVQYKNDRQRYKDLLKPNMILLKDTLSQYRIFRSFLRQSFFEVGQVDFFSVQPPHTEIWHIFDKEDAIDTLSQNLSVENSRARHVGQTDAQKVVFKHETTHGEIEIRTGDRKGTNYKLVKFWMDSQKTITLLQEKIKKSKKLNENLFVWGKAVSKFKLPSDLNR